MLALAEILALLILNALIQAAFLRWKIARHTVRQKPQTSMRAFHYPLHPSPVGFRLEAAAPQHAAHIRPAGMDW